MMEEQYRNTAENVTSEKNNNNNNIANHVNSENNVYYQYDI